MRNESILTEKTDVKTGPDGRMWKCLDAATPPDHLMEVGG